MDCFASITGIAIVQLLQIIRKRLSPGTKVRVCIGAVSCFASFKILISLSAASSSSRSLAISTRMATMSAFGSPGTSAFGFGCSWGPGPCSGPAPPNTPCTAHPTPEPVRTTARRTIAAVFQFAIPHHLQYSLGQDDRRCRENPRRRGFFQTRRLEPSEPSYAPIPPRRPAASACSAITVASAPAEKRQAASRQPLSQAFRALAST